MHGVMFRWMMAGVVINVVGCYGTRSSLQMDSDSRAPQFGVAVPISTNGKSAKILPTSSTKPRGKLVEVTVEEPDEEPARWKKWLGLATPKPLPLPRTDLKQDGSTVEHRAPSHNGLEDF